MTVQEQSEAHALNWRFGDAHMRLLTLLALFLALYLYWDPALNLVQRWGQSEELSHSYFIPIISGWLIWTNRKAVNDSVGHPSSAALLFFVLALMLRLLGELVQFYFLQQVSLVIFISGFITGLGGLSLLRVLAAPVAFLFLAIPPPNWAMTLLSLEFQHMSSQLGVAMLRWLDVPVYLTGNIIDLGVYKLQVEEACNGLNYLFPFFSLATIAAYLYRGPYWQKALIIASSVPITILFNSFRIAITGVLVNLRGIEHAEGFIHAFEGWVVFLLCMLALLAVIFVLNLFARPRRSLATAINAPDLSPQPPSSTFSIRPTALWMGTSMLTGFALIISILAMVDEFEIPDRRDFELIPYEFGELDHEVRPIDAATAAVLGADDSIVVNFYDDRGEVVNLYMAYLEERRNGRSWHSPRQCIPGGGWRITEHTISGAATSQSGAFEINRLIIENQGNRQLVYYWYDQRGRKIANEFVMQYWTVFDTVTRKRPDGALVRLITPIDAGESVEEAELRLTLMTSKLDAVLADYVPH